MSHTETTYTSWFERIKSALIGALVGLVLLIGCIWLLIWNEGRAIQTYRALSEGASQVISVDGAAIDSANEGKLVHISGAVKSDQIPQDSQFGVIADRAVGLSRSVAMYQWVEKSESQTKKTLGGGEETTTTYSYTKEWRSDIVDSSRFKQSDDHQNPTSMPDGATFTAKTAHVGAFSVPGKDVAGIGDYSRLALTDSDVQRIAVQVGASRPAKRNSEGAYIGLNENLPDVGDLRITYQRIDVETASIVGKQSHSALVPYETTNHRDIFLTADGHVDAGQMFKTAESENSIITWLVRACGLIGLFVSFKLMFALLPILADLIPFLGSVIGFGTSIVACVLTLLVGPVVIAIGWFAYRPLLSVGIIAGGILLAVIVTRLRRKAPLSQPQPA
ncbi:TMEM43 family protein [Rhizobium sp. 768_B6_N1_8]|uniref:TMEM43 family protein n=1 Tax=unclassified Rhizobium TaxID=2613769 RepID=UPI003F21C0A5